MNIFGLWLKEERKWAFSYGREAVGEWLVQKWMKKHKKLHMARRKASRPCVYLVFLLVPASKVNHHCNRGLAYAVGVEDVSGPFWARMCPLQQLQVSWICPSLPPANLPAPNGSGGWGLQSYVQGSLPTAHLLPGVGACVSSGIHYGDLRLLSALSHRPAFLTCSWTLLCLGEILRLKNSTAKLFTLRLKRC